MLPCKPAVECKKGKGPNISTEKCILCSQGLQKSTKMHCVQLETTRSVAMIWELSVGRGWERAQQHSGYPSSHALEQVMSFLKANAGRQQAGGDGGVQKLTGVWAGCMEGCDPALQGLLAICVGYCLMRLVGARGKGKAEGEGRKRET